MRTPLLCLIFILIGSFGSQLIGLTAAIADGTGRKIRDFDGKAMPSTVSDKLMEASVRRSVERYGVPVIARADRQ